MLAASLVISQGTAVLLTEDLSMLLARLATNAENLVISLAIAHRRPPMVTFLAKLSILVSPLW